MAITPINLDEANAFVATHHRHHKPVPGAKFSVAVSEGETVRGVAIVGRPVARMADDGWTLEVNRVCTDGAKKRPAPCCMAQLGAQLGRWDTDGSLPIPCRKKAGRACALLAGSCWDRPEAEAGTERRARAWIRLRRRQNYCGRPHESSIECQRRS